MIETIDMPTESVPPPDGAIAEASGAGTPAQQEGLLFLRQLVLTQAAQMPDVGRVEEGLRWGQVAFLTPETKSGSSLRIAPVGDDRFALYVHCQTDLIARFRDLAGAGYETEGNRAVVFADTEFAQGPVCQLIGWALRYHLKT